MQGLNMRFIVFLCLAFLIVSQYFCFCAIHPDHLAEVVDTIIDETKSKEPKKISKKVITDLEKCAKTKKDAVTKVVLKCLSDIKRQQNFLDKKDKTVKDISKKVVTKLVECINKSKIPPKKSLDHIPPEIMEETFRTTTPHTLLSFMADICPKFRGKINRITWITFPSWKQKLPTEADLRRQ